MLHGKTKTHMTNMESNFVFGELIFFMPAEMNLPKSYAEAKRVLSEFGMGYETIDVCKYDCRLFSGDHASSTHCKVEIPGSEEKGSSQDPSILSDNPTVSKIFFFQRNVRDTRWNKDRRVVEKNVM